MRFFRGKQGDVINAMQEAWNEQDSKGQPRSAFVMASKGVQAIVHTLSEDPAGEELLRGSLSSYPHDEGDKEQSKSWVGEL